jgi:hypothetical protein
MLRDSHAYAHSHSEYSKLNDVQQHLAKLKWLNSQPRFQAIAVFAK